MICCAEITIINVQKSKQFVNYQTMNILPNHMQHQTVVHNIMLGYITREFMFRATEHLSNLNSHIAMKQSQDNSLVNTSESLKLADLAD